MTQPLPQFKCNSASISGYVWVFSQWKVLSTLESRPCHSSSDFLDARGQQPAVLWEKGLEKGWETCAVFGTRRRCCKVEGERWGNMGSQGHRGGEAGLRCS